MKKISVFLTFAFLTIAVKYNFAQGSCGFEIRETPGNNPMSTCSNINLVYSIKNNNSTTYTLLTGTIHLPLGITFSSFNAGTSTSGVTTGSASGNANPVFSIPVIPANDSVIITISASTPCQQNLLPALTVIDLSSTVLGNCSMNAPSTMNVLAPTVIVSDNNTASVLKNTGDIAELVYTIQNTAALVGTVPSISINCSADLTTQLLGYCILSPPNCTYTPITGGVINIAGTDIQAALGNSLPGLLPGNSLTVKIKYKVTGYNNTGNGTYTFSFGCGPNTCTPIVMNSDIDVLAGTPVIAATSITPYSNTSFCPGGQTHEMGFIYTNNGTIISGGNPPPAGCAKMVDLKIFLMVSQQMGTLDINSFRVNGVSIPVTAIPDTPVVYFYNSIATGGQIQDIYVADFTRLKTSFFGGNAAPFGPNSLSDIDGDGQIDDLAESTPGVSKNFKLTFNYTYLPGCPASFPSAGGTSVGVATQEKFQNQCYNLSDVHTFPYSVTNTAEYAYNYASWDAGSTFTVPADVEANIPFIGTICPHSVQVWSPSGFDFACPNGYHQFKIILPPGFHISSGVSTINIPLTDPCNPLLPPTIITASAVEVPPAGSDPGYLLLNSTRLPASSCNDRLTTFDVNCFQVPMELICESNPNVINFGFDQFTCTYEYICDASCATCQDVISASTAETYHHCNGACAQPFYTTSHSFTFKRNSFGYAEGQGLVDCNDTPVMVDPNSPAINRQAAYPGDKIIATLEGGFQGANGAAYESMFFQLRYDKFLPSVASSEELFMQDPNTSSTVTITGAGTYDGTYPLSYVYVPSNPLNPIYEMNFKLPPGILQHFTSADVHFVAELNLIAKNSPNNMSSEAQSFYSYGRHKIDNLRAEFGGARFPSGPPASADTSLSCDSWGDNFTMLQPQVGSWFGGTVSNCDEFWLAYRFGVVGALWGTQQDDFPNELRPYAALNNHVSITLPAGYQYISAELETTENNYSPVIPLTPSSVSGSPSTGLTFTFDGIDSATPCWPLLDLDYFAYSSEYVIAFKLKPECNAPASSDFSVTSVITQSIQAEPQYWYDRNVDFHHLIYHVNPLLNLVPPPTVNSFANTVNFDFEFCNTTANNAPHSWIHFENPANVLAFNSVSIIAGSVSLPFVADGAGILVDAGLIPPFTCVTIRLSATVTPLGCVDAPLNDQVNVTWGNECAAPVTITSESRCQQGTATFNFTRYPSRLNLLTPEGFPSASVSPCAPGNTITYNFMIENPSAGSVSNPVFWMHLPPGIQIQNADFTYPYSTGTTVSAPAPAYTFGTAGTDPGWNISSMFSSVLTNGLTGIGSSAGNQIGVTLTLVIDCSYDQVSALSFHTEGISSCSLPLTPLEAIDHPVIAPGTCCNPCTVNAGDDVTICRNTSTALTATGGNNYLWMPGGYATAGINVSPSETTTYTVTSTNGEQSCTDEVTVFVNPAPEVIITASDTSLCFKQPAGLIASGAVSYTWTASTGSNPPANDTISVTPSVATTYIVTGTDANGCSNTASVTITINPMPVITVSASPNPLCIGQPSILTATGAGTGGIYSWTASPGPDPSGNSNSVTVYPTETTVYTVDGLAETGCTGQSVVVVTVNPAPVISIAPGKKVICEGGSFTLHASGGVSYSWEDGTGVVSTNANATVSPSVTTTYTVTGTDSNGCSATATATVTVYPTPNVIITGPTAVCAGQSAILTASGADTYLWSTGETTASISVNPVVATTYTVDGAAGGCNDASEITITVNPLPTISVTKSKKLCEGDSITLSATGGVSYTWEASTGVPLPSGSSIVVSPSTTTTYTVTGTSYGCSNTAATTVYVTPAPVVTVTPQDTTICSGEGVMLQASGATTYTWASSPPSSMPGGDHISVHPAVTTTYTVTGTTGACSGTSTTTITVNPVPSLSVSPGGTICKGQSTDTLTASMTPAGGTYLWTPSSGVNPSATSPVVTVSPGSTTTYTVTGTQNGCSTSQTVTVTVIASITVTATGPIFICSGESLTLGASGAGTGGIYTWTSSPPSVIPNGASVTIWPSATAIYTVTGTNALGCSDQDTIKVIVKDCKCGGKEVPAVINSTITYTGDRAISVNTTINADVTFQDASVAIASGVTITVNANKKLTINHSHLWACQDMWKGIVVQQGGKLIITSNSLIEDADTAVYVPSSTYIAPANYTLRIENSTFNKNYIALKIANCVGSYSGTNSYPFIVTGSVFTNRSLPFSVTAPYTSTAAWPTTLNLKTLYLNVANPQDDHYINATTYPVNATLLKAPYAGQKSYCGISLNNVGKTVNPTSTPTYHEIVLGSTTSLHGNPMLNLYDNIAYGIHSINSNFSTCNSAYQYLATYGKGNGHGGIGVYGFCHNGTYRRSRVMSATAAAASLPDAISLALGNTFYHVPVAVDLRNYYETVISHADVRSMQVFGSVGTALLGAPGGIGFYLKTSQYRSIQVNANRISNIRYGVIFISDTDPNHHTPIQIVGPVAIDYNTIQAHFPGFAVSTQYVQQAIDASDLIDYSNGLVSGSGVISTSKNSILNVLNGIKTGNWQVQISRSDNNYISMLQAGGASYSQFGIRHDNNKKNTIINNNVRGAATSKDAWTGIYSALNNFETVSCNYVYFLGRGIEFSQNNPATSFVDNTFEKNARGYVLSTNGVIGVQPAAGSSVVTSDNKWLNPWAGSKTHVISSIATNSKLNIRNSSTYDLSAAFNTGSIAYLNGAASSLSTSIITLSPTGFRSCSTLPSYNCNCMTSMLEKVVRSTLPYAIWPGEADYINKSQAFRLIKTDTSLMGGSPVLDSFYLATQNTSVDLLSKIEDDLTEYDFVNAGIKIRSFAPANTIETNYQTFYEMYLKHQTDTISISDSAKLSAIANGCPATDGPVVYQARVLLNSIYNTYNVYSDNCSEPPARSLSADEEEQTPAEYLVYPNPAKEEVYISVTDPELKEALIEITDITGKQLMLKKISFESGIGRLDLNVENGIYFISIRDAGKRKMFTQKIVIAK